MSAPTTPAFGLPLPSPDAPSQRADVERIAAALIGLEAALLTAVAALNDGKLDASAHTWATLIGKPTTMAALGITNVYTKTEVDAALAGRVAPEASNTFTAAQTIALSGIARLRLRDTGTVAGGFVELLLEDDGAPADKRRISLRVNDTGGFAIGRLNDTETGFVQWLHFDAGGLPRFSAGPGAPGSIDIAGTTASILLTETDQTGPAGRWRWLLEGDKVYLQRATDDDSRFTLVINPITVSNTGAVAFSQAPTAGGTPVSLAGHAHSIANITGLQAALDAKVSASAPVFTGPIVEVTNARSNTGASIALDGTRTVLRHNVDQSTTITLPSAPATTNGVYTLTLALIVNGTSTITWVAPAGQSIKWTKPGTAPTPPASGKEMVVTLMKFDGDPVWRGAATWVEA